MKKFCPQNWSSLLLGAYTRHMIENVAFSGHRFEKYFDFEQ